MKALSCFFFDPHRDHLWNSKSLFLHVEGWSYNDDDDDDEEELCIETNKSKIKDKKDNKSPLSLELTEKMIADV